MKKVFKIFLLMLALLSVILLSVACSGGEDNINEPIDADGDGKQTEQPADNSVDDDAGENAEHIGGITLPEIEI